MKLKPLQKFGKHPSVVKRDWGKDFKGWDFVGHCWPIVDEDTKNGKGNPYGNATGYTNEEFAARSSDKYRPSFLGPGEDLKQAMDRIANDMINKQIVKEFSNLNNPSNLNEEKIKAA